MEITTAAGRFARPKRARSRQRWLLAPLATAEFALGLYASGSIASAFLVVVGALAVVACFVWPVATMAIVFPASFGYWRVGPAAAGMSVTDAVAMLGALAALPYVPWRSPLFRRAFMATAGYAIVLLVADIAHPSKSTIVETGHRFVLVMGAICVGSALGRLGHARLACRALLAAAAVVSVAAIIFTLTHHLQPGYPFGMQKNSAGVIITMSFVILFTQPKILGFPRTLLFSTGGLLLAGLAATQSRGSGLALIVVFSVYVMRNSWQGNLRKVARFAPVMIVASIAILVIAATTYTDRDANKTGSAAKYTSVATRTSAFDTAWHDEIVPNPIFGGGLKWFVQPDSPGIIPHNLIICELSEVGLFGTTGFVLLLLALLSVTRRLHSEMGEMAWYLLTVRVLASMVDVFWAAGPGTLPFLVIGLAIGDDEAGTAVAFEPRAMLGT